MKSILQEERECLICQTPYDLHRHHCFEGSNRKKSEKYGLTVYLCANHHNMSNDSVHLNESLNKAVKKWAQEKAMQYYNWNEDDFRKIFRRSYL